MFQFPRFPFIRYELAYECMRSAHAGFPIRISPDLRLCAPPRSFSQLAASFLGSQCQGIHPALLMLDLCWSTSPLACGSVLCLLILYWNPCLTLIFHGLRLSLKASILSNLSGFDNIMYSHTQCLGCLFSILRFSRLDIDIICMRFSRYVSD